MNLGHECLAAVLRELGLADAFDAVVVSADVSALSLCVPSARGLFRSSRTPRPIDIAKTASIPQDCPSTTNHTKQPTKRTNLPCPQVGAEKPCPVIFEEACRALGVEPQHAVHVGDDRRWAP